MCYLFIARAIRCDAMRCDAIRYDTIRYDTIRYFNTYRWLLSKYFHTPFSSSLENSTKEFVAAATKIIDAPK